MGWRRVLAWGERVLVVGVLIFAAWRLGPQLSAWTGIGVDGRPAPELSVRTLEGRWLSLEELEGKVVVLNFWATWCPPCRIEMPALQRLHEEHADRGLVVLGLSLDRGGAAEVRRYLDREGLDFPVAMAGPGHRRAVGGRAGVPTTLLSDRRGRVRHRVYGLFAPPALGAAVGRLLDEPAPEEAAQAPARSSGSSSPSGTKSSARPLLQ